MSAAKRRAALSASTVPSPHCPGESCATWLRVPDTGEVEFVTCHGCGEEIAVTAAQVDRYRKAIPSVRAEIASTKERLSAVVRYPFCDCGGPLMLPQQARVKAGPGRLLCPAESALVDVPQEVYAQARAAAEAECWTGGPS